MKPYFCFLIGFLFYLFPSIVFSQQDASQKKEVEIINADYLRMFEIDGKKFTHLVGNVQLKQEQMTMFCDSADLDKETNTVQAWGGVHIQQDTMNGFSKYMKYDGNQKYLMLQKGVVLSDSKMKIYTEELFYNTKDKVAYYYTGGKVLRGKTVIKSQHAYYYTKTSDIFFRENVDIKDPEYHLTSDTLQYNTNRDEVTFFGNTIIDNKTSKIFCDNGWYKTKENVANFGKGTKILDAHQTLLSDSLYYDRGKGMGHSYKNFSWKDTSMAMEITGEKGDYLEENEQIKVFNKALMIYLMDKDTLYLTADTLRAQRKSKTDSTKEFYGYHRARLCTHQMQAVSDSIFYSFKDSTFRLFQNPYLWTDSLQMKADSIYLFVKNKKADKLSLLQNGFIISPSGSKYFDQVKGKNIFGYFKENDLNFMRVETNAESLYFGKDDAGKYLGANHAKCENMSIYFAKKKIARITFINKPDAVFSPLKKMEKSEFILPNFDWKLDKKPNYPDRFFNLIF